MLESKGSFFHKCTTDEVEAGMICEQQKIRLVRVPLIVGVCSISSPLLGHVVDRYGSDVIMHILGIFRCVGISLVIVASATKTDWILFVAFSFLYLVQISGSIMITKTGFLFDNGNTRPRVISVLNSLLDATSVTYLILLKILQGVLGATFFGVMEGHLGMVIVCFGTSSYQCVRMLQQLEKEGAKDSNESEPKEEKESINPSVVAIISHAFVGKEEHYMGGNEDNPNEQMLLLLQALPINENEGVCQRDPNSNHVLIRRRNAKEQLRFELFLLLLVFFTVHTVSKSFTLMTNRDFLGYFEDDGRGNKYLSIFTFLQTGSIVCQPDIDPVLRRYGNGAGL